MIVIGFSIVGLIVKSPDIPINFSSFLLALTGDIKYNGAWWFVRTYILLVLLSPVIYKIVKKLNPVLSLVISGIIYCVAYLMKMEVINIPVSNELAGLAVYNLIRFGMAFFPYVTGMVFYKTKFITFLRVKLKMQSSKLLPFLLLLFMAAMFAAHAFVQSLGVAVLTAIGTVVCFSLWKKPKVLNKAFNFMGNQSTNIWLIHMFFYNSLFRNLVFIAKYPVFVFIFMMAICICVSLILNFALKYLNALLFKKRA